MIMRIRILCQQVYMSSLDLCCRSIFSITISKRFLLYFFPIRVLFLHFSSSFLSFFSYSRLTVTLVDSVLTDCYFCYICYLYTLFDWFVDHLDPASLFLSRVSETRKRTVLGSFRESLYDFLTYFLFKFLLLLLFFYSLSSLFLS
ncbi:hypothetical protein GCK32_006292 [Trichostrongylus colubriformis]|uniref:Uncharacterized protein n=1 Tax=Trichostrongylus colubriformis TaxID=6319 RepID=A0AAN8ETS1_TRICO